ncbi:phosphatases II [Athelia psychrophila]|uniref:Phosphatases II n=1 Tax=Athelia psychrophila TaxID=1759441 RepID=A0A166EDC2_9AGAM|nr:phosphatases II [Fibularhizoctonia sp. CBS 109695]
MDLQSYKGYLRYADVALRLYRSKESMLAYGCAFQNTDEPKVKSYCLKQMAQCSRFSEWGCVFTGDEMKNIPSDLLSHIVAPWNTELRTAVTDFDLSPTLSLPSKEALFLYSDMQPPFQKLPRFFRWLVPFQFAIMSTPRDGHDISLLNSPHLRIRHVLTLTEEEPLPRAWFTGTGIKHTHLPIPNEHPPTIEQMDLIMRLFEDDALPLLVHCGGGKGRAGTVAACYLVAYGFRKPDGDSRQPVMSANEAIAALRAIRPGSIETSQQEAFVLKWCSAIWKRQHVVPPLLPEPLPTPLSVEGELNAENDLFVLVGLPGSGKSWFSKAILARHSKGWLHISQDESGSRAISETEIGRRPLGRVILDRCNTSAADRRNWLRLAAWAKSPVCVWFDYDRDLCISRAQNRPDHPTLPPGGRVRNAMDQMEKAFVKPSLQEGFKAVVTIRSIAASQEFVLRLSPAVKLYKYPRTPHLLNLGAATDDDLVGDSSVGAASGHVVITEKVLPNNEIPPLIL